VRVGDASIQLICHQQLQSSSLLKVPSFLMFIIHARLSRCASLPSDRTVVLVFASAPVHCPLAGCDGMAVEPYVIIAERLGEPCSSVNFQAARCVLRI